MTIRVPVVTQVTATECGTCCVAALFAAYGRHESITSLRQDLEVGRDGASVRQLADLLRSRGMSVRSWRVARAEALAAFGSPVIIFWENHHFVILERLTSTGAILMDPAVGRRRVSAATLAGSFSGIAISAEPTETFSRQRRPVLSEWRSFPLLTAPARRALMVSVLLTLVGYAITAVMPIALQWTVDSFGQPDAGRRLWMVLALTPLAALLYFVLQGVRTLVLSRTLALVGSHLMDTIFHHLLRLPFSYFSTRPVGELLYRLGSVTSIRDLLSVQVISGVLDIGTAAILLAYVFWVSPALGGLTALVFSVSFVLLLLTRRPVTEAMESEIAHLSKSQSIQFDAISAISAVKMGGYSDTIFVRWKREYDASIQAMRRRMHLEDGLIGGALGAVQLFGPLMLVVSGLILAQTGTVSLGAAIAVQGVGALLLSLSSSIFASWTDFIQSSRLMRRVLDITETSPEPTGACGAELTDAAVTLERASFAYHRGAPEAVASVDLHVRPGESVAIVGASGSGKSTLAQLMCGLHHPTSGRVRIGERDVSEWDLDRLRRQIGYVSQDIRLHDGPIVDNLRVGTDLTQEETIALCQDFTFLDFINELPMGYQTVVAEQGANFSGGQRQRMAIARALLRRPRLVVLDEATSALDTVTERQVTEHLAQLGCTQVILAHRLSTIRDCDRVHVLADGRLVESGTHDALITAGGLFAELYAADHVAEGAQSHA